MSASRKSNARSSLAGDPTAKLWSLGGFLFGLLLTWAFLAPADATSVFNGGTQPQVLLVLAGCVGVAAAAALTGQGFRFSVWQWIVALLSLGLLLFVAFLAGEENNPRIAWYGFWHCIALVGFYLIARALLRAPAAREAALTIVLVGFCSLAAHGVFQVAVGFPASRAEYEKNPDKVIESSGLDAPAGSPLRKRFEDRLYSPEPYSTFSLANSLAVALSGGLVIAIAVLATQFRNANGASKNSALIKGAALAACLLILVAWFLTRSRTAYLSVLLAISVWGLQALWIRRARKRALPVKAIITAVTLTLVASAGGVLWLVRNDVLVISEAAKSFAFRLQYWQATLAMIRDHGLWGVGLGNFQSYYPSYMLPEASETVADPHNWFLDIAATLSLPIAIVVTVWLCRQLLRTLAVEWRAERTPAADSQSESTTSPYDESIALGMLVGAGVGVLGCTLAIELLVGIDLPGVWMASLVGILLGVVLKPAVGQVLREAPAALGFAVLAMVVCLLASGSWQAPGIAFPLLTLLVCGAVGPSVAQPASEPRGKEVAATPPLSRKAVWRLVPIALPLAGFVGFVFQSWMPSTKSWALIQQAGLATSLNEQLKIARSAMNADPLDSEPKRFMAQLLVADALHAPSGLFSKRSAEALAGLELWLASDSARAINWQFAGDRAFELAAQGQRLDANQDELLEKVCDYYQEASRRHPTSAQLHLQWAIAQALVGDLPAAKTGLAAATELSENSPHADKKLSALQIWLPIACEGIGNQPRDSIWVPAEPVAEWIRTL